MDVEDSDDLYNDNDYDDKEEDDHPKEAIAVLYDTSGSMSQVYFDEEHFTRMGAVNAFFSAFADKTMAFEYNHIVQLY